MKITLIEAEIKEAISAYIFERVSINEGMELTVEIRATRGDDGATAEVDISAPKTPEDEAEKEVIEPNTQQIFNPVKRTRRTKAEIEAARAAEEQPVDATPLVEETKSSVADDYLAMTEAAETVTEEQEATKVDEYPSEPTTLVITPSVNEVVTPSVNEGVTTDEIPAMFRRDRTNDDKSLDAPNDGKSVDEPVEEAAPAVKTGSLFGNLRRPQN